LGGKTEQIQWPTPGGLHDTASAVAAGVRRFSHGAR
jgi:hypothetical protein